ncbi:hypothetical protein [Nocardia ignorata]|uniref:Uncharacterized protein n=1 Tax=Nocardia ignorata TaxID=145285 RepID=A0A4R6P539_NOCIG|nr:hypothetical protein [Nocardia ignorata]TDP32396.1 hypothetical protein DFR75_106187 [Nocardia ignorata]
MLEQEKTTTLGDVTAVVAVTLGALAAVANLLGAAYVLRTFFSDPELLDDSLVLFSTLGALAAAFAFGYGALLLARRDDTGRWVLIVAAAAQLGLGLLALLATLIGYDSGYGIHWFADQSVLRSIFVGLGGVPGAVTAIVNHNWTAAGTSSGLGAIVLLMAVLPWTAAYTRARPKDLVGPAV